MNEDIIIKETTQDDLDNIRRLWACGEVMNFVGFPEGLIYSSEEILRWYESLREKRPKKNHFSIFYKGEYAGETFYNIDGKYKSASMDIKLFPKFQSKGIARRSLSFAIDKAFDNGAILCRVNPNQYNKKAITLYENLGFIKKDFPKWVDANRDYIYYEIKK